MPDTIRYNIYKINVNSYDDLLKKIEKVGLVKQKNQTIGNYEFTFYFSEKNDGQPVWWYETYKSFINDQSKIPKNIFYYGLMVCVKRSTDAGTEKITGVYAISLGKSHFYLHKFITRNFGLEVAIKIADEKTVLLKKSRYFSGGKRNELSQYEKFSIGDYEAGESIDNLKMKAKDTCKWGGSYIIFSDSIQISSDRTPNQLEKIFIDIDKALEEENSISLPRLLSVKEEFLIEELDQTLLDSLKCGMESTIVEQFSFSGGELRDVSEVNKYKIYILKKDKFQDKKLELDSLTISDIYDYLIKNEVKNINDVKVQISPKEGRKYTTELKSLLGFYFNKGDETYYIKDGCWNRFNQPFIEYLHESLNKIEFKTGPDLDEKEFIRWKKEKEIQIESPDYKGDKILYREYYFNNEMKNEGYENIDRNLKIITSSDDVYKYKYEAADLFKDDTVYAVKIGDEQSSKSNMVYNISQSVASLEIIQNSNSNLKKKIKKIGLWFVTHKKIEKIHNIKSIVVLLKINAWKNRVVHYGFEPTICVSEHKNYPKTNQNKSQ